MEIFALIILIIISLFLYYQPYIDIESDKVIIWYYKSFGRERVYKIIWIKKNE